MSVSKMIKCYSTSSGRTRRREDLGTSIVVPVGAEVGHNPYKMADSWALSSAAQVGIISVTFLAVNAWLLRRYFAGGVCKNRVSLKGKTAVVTGANCGIGKEVARELARRGARVILACRNLERGEDAAADIRSQIKDAELAVKQLELASLASVREFVANLLKEEPRLDILINNAGVFFPPEKSTQDGFEIHYGVNHLGHFLLTSLLRERLCRSAPSRVVVVSSMLAHTASIDFENFHGDKEPADAKDRRNGLYAQSKLANLLFVQELARRLPEGVTVNAISPGIVWTQLGRYAKFNPLLKYLAYPLLWVIVKRPQEGAQTAIHCATDPDLTGVSGKYFRDCAEYELPVNAKDEGVAKKLWELSERLTGLN